MFEIQVDCGKRAYLYRVVSNKQFEPIPTGRKHCKIERIIYLFVVESGEPV